MGFSRQEYWSGWPFPPPEGPPNPGIKPRSPTLQAVSLPRGGQDLTSVRWVQEKRLRMRNLKTPWVPMCPVGRVRDWGSFPLTSVNLVELLEVRTKSRDLSLAGLPRVCDLHLSSLGLQQLINYSSSFSTPASVPTEVIACEFSALIICDSLCLPVSLSSLGGSGMPWDLPSLKWI